MKKLPTIFVFFMFLCLIMAGCDGFDASGKNQKINKKADLPHSSSDLDDVNLEELGIIPVVWNGGADMAFAVDIEAVQNASRKNASGIKISSNAHSAYFPGIYFIWDSTQKDNGYLKVSSDVFALFESFTLTAKQGNTYWDLLIAPVEGQQKTHDGCYVFFIPKVNNNKNINTVFIDEWVLREINEPEEPISLPEPEPVNGFGSDPNDGLQVGNVIWAKTNIDTYQTFAAYPDMATCFYQWNRSKAWPPYGNVSGWNSTSDDSSIWIDSPIPAGWRLPTEAEYQALIAQGTVWAEADPSNSARGNLVIGRFIGPDCKSATMSNMGKSIFIPATGFRFESGSVLYAGYSDYDRGVYWSSTISWTYPSDLEFYYPQPYPYVRVFYFSINFALSNTIYEKNTGANIRPVRDVRP